MNIGIDIDDTISKTFETIIEYCKIYDKEVVKNEERTLLLGSVNSHRYIEALFHWTEAQKLEFFNSYYKEIIQKVELKENVKEVLSKLKQEGHKVYIVTARSDKFIDKRYNKTGKIVNEITKKWLNENDLNYDELIVDAEDKERVCKEKQIDLFIDDSYVACEKIQKVGTKTLYMTSEVNKKVNVKDKKIKRVYSWSEIYQEIKELENKI